MGIGVSILLSKVSLHLMCQFLTFASEHPVPSLLPCTTSAQVLIETLL